MTKLYIVTKYSFGCKYLEYFLQDMPLMLLFFFCLPRKFFMPYLMIFKRAFVICLPGQVKLWAYCHEIWKPFDVFWMHRHQKLNNKVKISCNANTVLPINPLGPIVHGLYFSSDNVFSIRCIMPLKEPKKIQGNEPTWRYATTNWLATQEIISQY